MINDQIDDFNMDINFDEQGLMEIPLEIGQFITFVINK